MNAAELLRRYPYDPKFQPAGCPVGSPERLRGCPPGTREPMAEIYARNAAKWDRACEVDDFSEFDQAPEVSQGIPEAGPARDAWDRTNTLLFHEWRAMRDKIDEYELENGRKLSVRARNDLFRAFRQRLAARYGATDVDELWREWDAERLRQMGKPPR